jgi:beta-lactamase regulating signal transducer with metallopeptidase domain
MTILLASTAGATMLLGIALIAGVALRRASAAQRHAVLAAAVLVALAAPALELLVPQLPVIRWHDPMPALSSGLTLTSADEMAASAAAASPAAREGMSWPAMLLSIWALGAMVTCAGLITSLLRLARLTARCAPVREGRWRQMTDALSHALGIRHHVDLLQSQDPSTLVASGWLRPRIILPAGLADWTDDRLRVVLIHELAHIRRHDGAIQLAGEFLRVVYWFNPLVWLACRRLRQESEHACDDAVLESGVDATDYASHLLAVARQVARRDPMWAPAPGIAHPSTLERRIVVMLHPDRRRESATRRTWTVSLAGALAISIPLAAVSIAPPEAARSAERGGGDVPLSAAVLPAAAVPASSGGSEEPPTARRPRPAAATPVGVVVTSELRPSPAPVGRPDSGRSTEVAAQREVGSIQGRVLDQSGGAMPGAQLTVVDAESALQDETVTDGAGRFAFRGLQPARYELVARLPGFASVSNVFALTSGGTIERVITLPLGTLQETITVTCGPEPRAGGAASVLRMLAGIVVPVLLAQAPAAAPVRVGGYVQAPRKLRDVAPACPTTTVPATNVWVRLTGRVGVDGFVNDLTQLPREPGSEPPREFVDSALEAVRQWQFTPTLLNGRPVDVNIAVHVLFGRD